MTAFKHTADERGTPFVEVDPIVCEYVREHGDSCGKEMFSRYVKEDEEIAALFPFQRLAHSFVIGGFGQNFEPEKEKRSNQILRQGIESLKERVSGFVDTSNPDAVSKADHYIAALDAQLRVCDETDAMIEKLTSPG